MTVLYLWCEDIRIVRMGCFALRYCLIHAPERLKTVTITLAATWRHFSWSTSLSIPDEGFRMFRSRLRTGMFHNTKLIEVAHSTDVQSPQRSASFFAQEHVKCAKLTQWVLPWGGVCKGWSDNYWARPPLSAVGIFEAVCTWFLDLMSDSRGPLFLPW